MGTSDNARKTAIRPPLVLCNGIEYAWVIRAKIHEAMGHPSLAGKIFSCLVLLLVGIR